MADKIVQLIDQNNNNIFPIARGLGSNTVSTGTIQDGAVTSDKIDWSTIDYSDRKIVGYMASNKPIYRFYYTVDNASNNGSYNIPTTLMPVNCTIVNLSILCYTTSGTISAITNYYNYGSDYARNYLQKDSSKWMLKTVMASSRTVSIVVEYTE